MNYGLTPAEQAAQRATQRADDTRRRRAQASTGPVTRTGTDVGVDWTPVWGGAREPNVPVDFTLRTRSIIPPMSNTLPVAPPRQEINPLPITPKPYVPGPMTGPTIRRGTDVGVDWTPVWGGAREPNVPVDFSRAGGTMRPPIRPQYDAPMPMPMPTLPSRIGPMTGPLPRDWQTGMSGLPAFEPRVPLSRLTPPFYRIGPMTGPSPRDWQTGMSGLPAFEPKVPLDLNYRIPNPMRQVVEGF
tara:strand:- start:5673 stop:6401 length:729 start_codon:yes stop_codon:yes gene_type:complete